MGFVAPRIRCGLQSLGFLTKCDRKEQGRNQVHTLFMGCGKDKGG